MADVTWETTGTAEIQPKTVTDKSIVPNGTGDLEFACLLNAR
jgi:hypothetical protein